MTQLSILEFSSNLPIQNSLDKSEKEEGGDFLSLFAETHYSSQNKKHSQENASEDEIGYTLVPHCQSLPIKENVLKEVSEGFEKSVMESLWVETAPKQKPQTHLEELTVEASSLPYHVYTDAGFEDEPRASELEKTGTSEMFELKSESSLCCLKNKPTETLETTIFQSMEAVSQKIVRKDFQPTMTQEGKNQSVNYQYPSVTTVVKDLRRDTLEDSLPESFEGSGKGLKQGLPKDIAVKHTEVSTTAVPLKNIKAEAFNNVAEGLADVSILKKSQPQTHESFQKQEKIAFVSHALGAYNHLSPTVKNSHTQLIDDVRSTTHYTLGGSNIRNSDLESVSEEKPLGFGLNSNDFSINNFDIDKKDHADSSHTPHILGEVSFLSSVESAAMGVADVQESLNGDKIQSDLIGMIADYFDKIKEDGRSWTKLSLGAGADHKVNLYIRMQGKKIGIRIEDTSSAISQELSKAWPKLSQLAAHKGMQLEDLNVLPQKKHTMLSQSYLPKNRTSRLNTII